VFALSVKLPSLLVHQIQEAIHNGLPGPRPQRAGGKLSHEYIVSNTLALVGAGWVIIHSNTSFYVKADVEG
jgi:hypothetical protein